MESHSPTDGLLAHADWVRRLARALLRDDDLADDVAQDVLAAALQRPPAFAQRPGRLRAWLGGITRHLAARALKDRRERPRREAGAARREAEPDDAAARLRLHRLLTDAVLGLPEPYRTAVALRFFDGLPPRAIARKLGRTPEAVRQHLHRGLGLLRARLDGEAGGRRAWAVPLAGLVEMGVSAAWTLAWIPVMTAKKTLVAAGALFLLSIGAFAVLGEGEPPAVAEVGARAGKSVAGDPNAGVAPAVAGEPTAAENRRVEAAFALQVLDRGGRPVAGAEARCWIEGGPVREATTDAEGRARFAAMQGRGGLLVTAPLHPPLVQELEALGGEHRVVLEEGLSVAGQIIEDGAPAAELELDLVTNARALPSFVPEEVAEVLRKQKRTATTDAQGAFSFEGLRPDWSGSLSLPRTHWFMRSDVALDTRDVNALLLRAPRSDLRLEVVRLPTVRGRVVWADSGEGVANVGVNAHATFADGEGSPSIGFRADEEGRFAVPVYPGEALQRWRDPSTWGPIAKVWVNADVPGAEGRAFGEWTAEELRARGGEVLLEVKRAGTRHFLAVDRDGRPIAGARVQAAAMSAPTGADGRGTFVGGKAPFLIGAPGYQVSRGQPLRESAGTEQDPLVFALEPENRVLIRLRRPDGSVPAVGYVALRSTAPLLPDNRLGVPMLHRLLGCAKASGWWSTSQGEAELSLRPDAKGNITLLSLLPAKPCELRVCDALGEIVTAKGIVTPELGEMLEVQLVVTAEPRRLHGIVLATDGSALPDAGVELRVPQSEERTNSGSISFTGTGTDAAGRFSFPKLYSKEAVTLVATRPGYAAQVREGLRPEDDGEPVVFRLEPGRTVEVGLADEHGEPVATLSVWTELPALGRVNPDDLGPGRFAFRDLPGGTVTFQCRLGGAVYRLAHDTSVPDAVLEIPRPGELEVLPADDWKPQDRAYDYADVTPLDSQGEGFQVGLRKPWNREAQLVPPGRYRIQAMRRHYQRGNPSWHETVGAAVEVAVRPGERTSVRLP